MTVRTFMAILLLALATASCQRLEEKPVPDKVTFQLKWVHQAQFAGFYVAQERGFYADENIDVTFLEGNQDVDIAQSVVSGNAHFGVIAPEDIIIKRSFDEPLVALAAIYRRSAVSYVSKAASGIEKPSDLKGKIIAAAGNSGSVRDLEFQLNALMEMFGLSPSQVTILPYDPSYTSFINGDVDVSAAYLTGGVISLREQGVDLNIIWPGDFGVFSYSDTLVTTDTFTHINPDLVLRFVRATLKGWREAIGDPRAAVQDVMKYARVKDLKLQTAMMEAQVPLIHTGEDHIGWMKEQDWSAMCRILMEQGILSRPVEARSVFTNEFIYKIYGNGSQ